MMGSASSKQEELRQFLTTGAAEFIKAHCALGEDDYVHADLFMESFVRFLLTQHKVQTTLLEREYVTTAWMADIVQGQCPSIRFIGSSQRVSHI